MLINADLILAMCNLYGNRMILNVESLSLYILLVNFGQLVTWWDIVILHGDNLFKNENFQALIFYMP